MYRRSTSSWVKHLDFTVLDIVVLLLTLAISNGIRNGFQVNFLPGLYLNTALAMVLIDVFVVFFNESYKGVLRRGYWNEAVAVAKHNLFVMGLTVFYLFITQTGQIYSRAVLIMHFIMATVLMYGTRILWKQHLRSRDKRQGHSRAMLLICDRKEAKEIVRSFLDNEFGRIRLSGIIFTNVHGKVSEVEGVPVVASGCEQAFQYIKNNWVDEVFVKLPREDSAFHEIIETCREMGVTIHLHIARLKNSSRQVVEKVGGYTVLTSSIKMATPKQIFVKRVMDICGGGSGSCDCRPYIYFCCACDLSKISRSNLL
ncbi:MAG: hypothetical protein PWP24_1712 [Clostridiales bacterium]|nr:hypothetical protein [Clostridiales bacterium]